jgi:hypothetical protein
MFTNRKQQLIERRESLVREVAERSVSDTLLQIGATPANMSPAELRGYVRAFALPFVRNETAQLVSFEWPRAAFDELASAALNQATHLIISRLKAPPVTCVPKPHVARRSAA